MTSRSVRRIASSPAERCRVVGIRAEAASAPDAKPAAKPAVKPPPPKKVVKKEPWVEPKLDPNTPSPIFGGGTGGLLRKAQVRRLLLREEGEVK